MIFSKPSVSSGPPWISKFKTDYEKNVVGDHSCKTRIMRIQITKCSQTLGEVKEAVQQWCVGSQYHQSQVVGTYNQERNSVRSRFSVQIPVLVFGRRNKSRIFQFLDFNYLLIIGFTLSNSWFVGQVTTVSPCQASLGYHFFFV